MPQEPKSTLPANSTALIAGFAPVPRLKERHDGWKPEIQRAFIEALAETGSVKAAARRVGRAAEGAYMLRRQPGAEEFRAAWQAALDLGVQKIEDVAMDRALNGVEVPVYSYGKLIGSRTVYNDRLLMFMLRTRAPDRFAGGKPGGMNAVDKMELKRLKKQWREEWERERWIADQEEEQETLAEIDEMLDRMRTNRWDNMSPRARAAYEEAKRIEEEDGTEWMVEEIEAEEEQDGPAIPTLPSPEEDEPEAKPEGPQVRKLTDERW
jgi:hypothetical protein